MGVEVRIEFSAHGLLAVSDGLSEFAVGDFQLQSVGYLEHQLPPYQLGEGGLLYHVASIVGHFFALELLLEPLIGGIEEVSEFRFWDGHVVDHRHCGLTLCPPYRRPVYAAYTAIAEEQHEGEDDHPQNHL